MKRGKHPTNKKRKGPQRKVKQYMELREDLQIAGRIPVEPEGAIRDERVDPASQGEQPLPGVLLAAVNGDRDGSWATPAAKKPMVVDELLGMIGNGEVSPVIKVMAANALTKADQLQYERDNPEEAGKAKGGTKVGVNVGVQINNYADLLKQYADGVPDTIEARVNEGAEELEVGGPATQIQGRTQDPEPSGSPTILLNKAIED